MQRYFIEKLNLNQKTAVLDKNDYHHIKNVMRLKVNDEIIICNNQGNCYKSLIIQFEDNTVLCQLHDEVVSNDMDVKVDIAQALIRRERFEYMIQKSTELGVNTIIPTIMKNVIIKLDQRSQPKKLARWNTQAKEASEQSHRNRLAKVDSITRLQDLNFKDYDVVLVAYEKENNSSHLRSVLQNEYKNILVVIGPEGGFTNSEIEYLSQVENMEFVGLGRRILRSETASSYILSILSYEYEMSD